MIHASLLLKMPGNPPRRVLGSGSSGHVLGRSVRRVDARLSLLSAGLIWGCWRCHHLPSDTVISTSNRLVSLKLPWYSNSLLCKITLFHQGFVIRAVLTMAFPKRTSRGVPSVPYLKSPTPIKKWSESQYLLVNFSFREKGQNHGTRLVPQNSWCIAGC